MANLAKLLVLMLMSSSGIADGVLCISSGHGAHVMPAFARCNSPLEHPQEGESDHHLTGTSPHECSDACSDEDCVDVPLPTTVATLGSSVEMPAPEESGQQLVMVRDIVPDPSAERFVRTGGLRPEIPPFPDLRIQTCRMIV